MPRSVRITVPSDRTDTLVAEIKDVDGLISLSVQRGISVQPPGDVVSVEVTTLALHALMRLLDRQGLSTSAASSTRTSEPLSVVAASQAEVIANDSSEATWEEMELTIARESNMTVNGLLLMASAGVIAVVGISTDTLHLVIGAMVIAPGFEPISRIALGAVARGGTWRRGLAHTAKGYLALALAAFVTALVLRASGVPPLGGEAAYLPAGVLASYWSSITASGLLVSTVAGATGGLLIAANRPVLIAGVMIALALIPSAALVGMALSVGDFSLFGKALLRWIIEVLIVGLGSAVVFAWKRASVQRRKLAF
jgi:uncharacterized membrane protein